MAAEGLEEKAASNGGSDVLPSETSEAESERKENGSAEPETEQAASSAEPKMEDVDSREVGKEDSAPTGTEEATATHEEPEQRPPSRPCLGDSDNNNEQNGEITMKALKEEPDDDSRSSGIDCDKSTSASEDGDKGSGGDLGDKRRSSLEVSSSDGEPLSRMDSEDSVCSTTIEMESIGSSGRSTPALLNGQSSARSSATKTMAYTCRWDLCPQCFNSSPDLAEHIRGIHVDGQRGGVFVCLWKGCKVYNTPSTSQSWLQRHMLTHSGDKPFKCVVGGCNASFASQGGLARHVPSHFSQQSSSKMSSQSRLKEDSPSKAGINKRKKLKNKRRWSLPRPQDFFDVQTMDALRHRAICLNLSTHIESGGNGHSVVFHSTVLAKRKEGTGKVKVLLHWTPEDILPDVWVNETERSQLKTKVVHLSQLPQDTAMLLDPNIYRALPQKRLKRSL